MGRLASMGRVAVGTGVPASTCYLLGSSAGQKKKGYWLAFTLNIHPHVHPGPFQASLEARSVVICFSIWSMSVVYYDLKDYENFSNTIKK